MQADITLHVEGSQAVGNHNDSYMHAGRWTDKQAGRQRGRQTGDRLEVKRAC